MTPEQAAAEHDAIVDSVPGMRKWIEAEVAAAPPISPERQALLRAIFQRPILGEPGCRGLSPGTHGGDVSGSAARRRHGEA